MKLDSLEAQVQVLMKTKKRSVNYIQKELPPCYFKSNTEPQFTVSETSVVSTYLGQLDDKDLFLTHVQISVDKEMVSGWHGWLSAIAKENEETDSIVEHLPLINAPITSPITVQEVIRISQAVSSEINQEFTFITCDLAVAKLAYQIIWQDPRKGWKTALSKRVSGLYEQDKAHDLRRKP